MRRRSTGSRERPDRKLLLVVGNRVRWVRRGSLGLVLPHLSQLKRGYEEPAGGPVRARVLFEHVLPTLLRLRAEDCAAMQGRCAFALSDGLGWTLDFARGEISNEVEDAVDLTLSMSCRDFEAFISGSLNAADALRSGRVRVEGRTNLLDQLAQLTALVPTGRGGDAP